jgi:hypothetical protein
LSYISRGKLHDITGAADRALSDFDKAIEIDPMSALAYFERAFHHFISKNDDLAGGMLLKLWRSIRNMSTS